jgi:hypothetical protein
MSAKSESKKSATELTDSAIPDDVIEDLVIGAISPIAALLIAMVPDKLLRKRGASEASLKQSE